MNNEKLKKTFVLISLGANTGDKRKNIDDALHYLINSEAITEVYSSSLYETEPVGFKKQDWFINSVIAGFTTLPLFALLQICKSIEYSIGRELRERWHEREIDIDILLYGDDLIERNLVTIPHPRMHERKFVLIPAAEIAAYAKHPKLERTISELLEECLDNSIVRHLN